MSVVLHYFFSFPVIGIKQYRIREFSLDFSCALMYFFFVIFLKTNLLNFQNELVCKVRASRYEDMTTLNSLSQPVFYKIWCIIFGIKLV